MKLTRILKVREEAGHSRRPPPVPRAPYSLPWTPSASSTSLIASPMAESLLQSSSATSSVPPQSPIASPRASSPSEPVPIWNRSKSSVTSTLFIPEAHQSSIPMSISNETLLSEFITFIDYLQSFHHPTYTWSLLNSGKPPREGGTVLEVLKSNNIKDNRWEIANLPTK
nr:hypothetical protein Iba_chr15bCG11640 [Ipomoea batatas]